MFNVEGWKNVCQLIEDNVKLANKIVFYYN